MPIQNVNEFYAYKITNASFQEILPDGTTDAGEKFGCIGSLDITTEFQTITRKCEGVEVENLTVPTKLTCTVSAHVMVDVLRRFFGFTNNGLVEGVFGYGNDSIPSRFIFTADIKDMRGIEIQLIALMNCSNSDGFKWTLENGADEVAEIELGFDCHIDSNGFFFYQAFESEIDPAIATQWHTNFTSDMVKLPPSP